MTHLTPRREEPASIAPVSVVIPYFRHSDVISRAVSSAFEQTYPPHEVIVVDDGSDEGDALTVALADLKRAYQDRLVIVSLSSNRGPSVARNEGWRLASQPLVAFLDSDDAWHLQKLEFQVPVMLEAGGPAISGHQSGINYDIRAPLDPAVVQQRITTFRQMLFRNRVPTRSVMVRRDVAQRFDPSLRHSEDYDLWLRIMAAHGPLTVLPYTLAATYKRPFDASGLSGQLFAMEKAQNKIYRTLRREGLTSPALHAVLLGWGFIRFARRLIANPGNFLRSRR